MFAILVSTSANYHHTKSAVDADDVISLSSIWSYTKSEGDMNFWTKCHGDASSSLKNVNLMLVL